jgi:hypothetical protein
MTTWTVRRQCHEKLVGTTTSAGLAANNAPTAVTDGMSLTATAGVGHFCPRARISLRSTIGTSFTCSVWVFDPTAEIWVLDTSLGTAGLVTVTTATNGGKQSLLVDTRGFSRVYVETITFAGANEQAEVWATGLTTP